MTEGARESCVGSVSTSQAVGTKDYMFQKQQNLILLFLELRNLTLSFQEAVLFLDYLGQVSFL